ncbi:class I SAM-dependent methyltransferase [Pelagicoccus sp. SDUM812003]|uniref:class I SAM-dependent methyltransferase n=1 Tax=Pelagicoccus sp. SDUM812003 TaxID=3041267 RepID=UPI00280E62F7|nr:class I SAM-dependent methyltransferase [Pelagicoccus sp. SDUM812003]MDQ8203579.1 class I SAM-dependent methyltransferase [Pelagicoccus sp. SDUM812003]
MSASQDLENESLIVCRNSQGTQLRATLMRMTRYLVTFEVYNPYSILQLSEVLGEFEIVINSRKVYQGRAIVSNMVNTGLVLVCEATLDEDSWLDVELLSPTAQVERLSDDFDRLIKEWEKVGSISAELKILISDIETFLTDIRRWTENIEMSVRSAPPPERDNYEVKVVEKVNSLVAPVIADQFKRFEEIAEEVPEQIRDIHRAFCRRQLHPLLLCAPFVHRTFEKPLGYAGDYEMVNMILRDPMEGASIFAKVVNIQFLATPPAEGHRNRIDYLLTTISNETRRCRSKGRRARIFNLGCGPAKEVQQFLAKDELCEMADFALLDFNEETITRTGQLLRDLKSRHRRSTSIRMIQRSVNQILKEGPRIGDVQGEEAVYDLVYCAGLFDYLSDRVCKRLLETFYKMTAPGGIVVATNVDDSNPVRNVMEYVTEWHLIYRNAEQFAELAPSEAPADRVSVHKDASAANIFLELRKPE